MKRWKKVLIYKKRLYLFESLQDSVLMIRPWHSKILKSLPVKKKTLTQMLIYEKVPIK